MTRPTRRLFLQRIKRFDPGDIANITTKPGMTSGETVYYDIHVLARAGRDITAAGSSKDKKEADWLAAETKRPPKLDKSAPPPTITPL